MGKGKRYEDFNAHIKNLIRPGSVKTTSAEHKHVIEAPHDESFFSPGKFHTHDGSGIMKEVPKHWGAIKNGTLK
jgi:hypothetical protein